MYTRRDKTQIKKSLSPKHPLILSLGSTHSLALTCTPPPQVALHSVQSLQSVHTGHLAVLHSVVSSDSPTQPKSLDPLS